MQYAITFQDDFTIVHEFLSNLRLNRQHQCVFLIFSAYFRYFVSSHKDGAHSQKAPNSLFSFFFFEPQPTVNGFFEFERFFSFKCF